MTVQAVLGNKGFEVISIHADVTLAEAIALLSARHIGAVLVMKDHSIEGILSERDVVRVLAKRGAAALEAPVGEVMTRKVVTCRRADTAASIMEKMTNGKFRHLPVVENDHVVGLISIGDIVKWRVKEYEREQEALRDYIKTA
jgi:CBS domain-containing protein